MKTALIAGYTGLVGRELLNLLLASDKYQKVIAIGRRKLDIEHEKLVVTVVDFDHIDIEGPVDDVFCCLGTTMKKAGSKERFRMVDFQYPLNLAIAGKNNGATTFVLVSASGANKNSLFFYNRVKGEIEEAIDRLAFGNYEVLRPSMLLGDRQETRIIEDIGKLFMKIFGFLFIGPLKNVKGVKASAVARAMIYLANDGSGGKRLHRSAVLQRF